MRRWNVDHWAGLVYLTICVLLGLLVLVMMESRVSLLIPIWAWAAVFVVFVGTLAGPFLDRLGQPATRALFAAQVMSAATLVLTAPTAGWMPILLVFVAAMSPMVVPMRITLVVVIFNSVVIAVATSRFTDPREAIMSAVLYVLLQLAAALASAASLREEKMRERLTEANAELQAASALREEASRADERLRISRELHDVLGHRLTALTLELETASHRSGAQSAAHVGRARGIARDLLGDVRGTVGELRRRAPDLREALLRFTQVPSPRVQVSVAEAVCLDEDQTVALVRIAQEIVTNAIRHSGASELQIDIGAQDGQITLHAADDGTGSASVEPGNGLRGIAERVQHLGGEVDFDGADGFRVEVRLAA